MSAATPFTSMDKQRSQPKFRTLESVVLIEARDSTDSAAAITRGRILTEDHAEAEPVAVSVTIRSGRLAVAAAVMIAATLSLVYTFEHGVQVRTFNAKTANATQQTRLLDEYNSRSANIATLFGKPIEYGVTLVVQVLVLRYMTEALTQTRTSRTVWVAGFALSAGAGYLISNGFNAVNVQVRSLPVVPVILASDLSAKGTAAESVFANRTTTLTRSISERQPENSIANSILRELVLPRATFNTSACQPKSSQYDSSMIVPSSTTRDYGFTRRDWQSRVLSDALPAASLTLVMNPTDNTTIRNVKSSDLPMGASLAADLFLYSRIYAGYVGYPSRDNAFSLPVELSDTLRKAGDRESVARFLGYLPPHEEAASESAQADWFLRKLTTTEQEQPYDTSVSNLSTSDISVTFSRTSLSPHIYFDSVTFEVEVDPKALATSWSADNKTSYTTLRQPGGLILVHNCGLTPGLCLVAKPKVKNERPTAVEAFATCVNKNGTEELYVAFESLVLSHTGYKFTGHECAQRSNSSMMLMSYGSRLVADALEQNTSTNGTATSGFARVTNLRKIYSVTVGRLSWQLENLSSTFHADCGDGTTSLDCLGLQFPLTPSSSSNASTEQRLVVNTDSLPTSLLPLATAKRNLRLVEVNDPTSLFTSDVDDAAYDVAVGDPLLPHNVKEVTWDMNQHIPSEDCKTFVAERLNAVVNNHLYMENTLQPAYTAGLFFLLQDAVVKDVIPLKNNQTTLSFDGNHELNELWVSIPRQSALFTVAGCAALLVAVLAVVLWPMLLGRSREDSLQTITAPHTIARVLLSDQQYPSTFLHRRVLGGTHDHDTADPQAIDTFVLASLALRPLEESSAQNEGSKKQDQVV